MQLSPAYLEAIAQLKRKGVTHIKTELEAQLDRDWGENECQDYIEEHVSEEANNARVYGEFYNDGSVDSEYTFTMPIDKAHLSVEYIKAFRALASSCGSQFDTQGAGMHISALIDGSYPTRKSLNRDKLTNFKKQVSQLLPALYLLASPDRTSRSLQYRKPQVSFNDKYSAIYLHNGHAIEYRIFETCYQRPEAFLDDIQIIAATMRYYSKLKVAVHLKPFALRESGQSVGRFYDSPEKLKALEAGLKYLCPKDKTIDQIKKERNFKRTPGGAARRFAKRMAEYKALYDEYREQTKRDVEYSIANLRADYVSVHASWRRDVRRYEERKAHLEQLDDVIAQAELATLVPPPGLDHYTNLARYLTPEDLDNVAKLTEVATEVGYINTPLTFDQYVADRESTNGRYRLQLT